MGGLSSPRLGAAGIAFLLLFVALLVCQGGYFPEAACVCGIAAALVAVLLAATGRLGLRGVPLVPTAFALAGCASLAGSALAGLTLGMAAEAASWFAALAVLVAELEREPLNPQLGEAVDAYFENAGVPDSIADRYEAAVARANELIEQWPATLLSNQEERGIDR